MAKKARKRMPCESSTTRRVLPGAEGGTRTIIGRPVGVATTTRYLRCASTKASENVRRYGLRLGDRNGCRARRKTFTGRERCSEPGPDSMRVRRALMRPVVTDSSSAKLNCHGTPRPARGRLAEKRRPAHKPFTSRASGPAEASLRVFRSMAGVTPRRWAASATPVGPLNPGTQPSASYSVALMGESSTASIVTISAQIAGNHCLLRQQQHRVTERVEPVSLADRLPVGVEHEFLTRERTDEHQQGGFRKMEVRQQGIDHPKVVPGENSQRGPAVVGLDGAAFPGDVFQRPDDGSTNGDNPARLVSRPGDRLGGGDRDAYVLGMKDVVSWILGHDGAERARADLQRDLRPACA